MQYTGVPLATLTAQVGGVDASYGVTVLAKDGYGMTFSAIQAAGGGFVTYDPVTGAERPPAQKLTVLIAYARQAGVKTRFHSNGTLLDADKAARLLQAGPNLISISIDGFEKDATYMDMGRCTGIGVTCTSSK